MKQKTKYALNILRRLSFDTYLWCASVVGAAILLCLSFFIGPVDKELSRIDNKEIVAPAGKIIEYSSILGNLDINSIKEVDELTECIPDTKETSVEGFDTVEEAIEASGVREYYEDNELEVEPYDDVPTDELSIEYEIEPVAIQEDMVTPNTDVDCTVDEIDLLNRVVQCEAQSEDLQGRILIANVILNRVATGIWGDTIEEVVKAPGQFDPVGNGAYKVVEPDETTKEAVLIALNGENISEGALYFQKSAAKNWGNKTYLFRYGAHSFYR